MQIIVLLYRVEMTTEAIDSMDELWKIFDSFPKTLVQNDCNPRNICIRKAATDQSASSDEDTRQMCIYDWELARIDVPQHDLAEFLAFVLPPDVFSILQQLMTNFGIYYLTCFVVLTYIVDITIFVARRHIN